MLQMQDKELLDDLFYRLKDIKEEKGMLHIAERNIDNTRPLTFYTKVTTQRDSIREVPLNLWDDLFYISNDLVHYTCLLFLLRPLINDATREDGTYHQNWYDARFLSYASALHFAVYNFWDRIGDLLYSFFETGLPNNSVYVGRVLNNFPSRHRESHFYKRLRGIYEDHVRPIVSERNEDAHTTSIPTSHFYGILLARGGEMDEKVEDKRSLPDVFREQIDFAYEGFELALRLIADRISPST